MQPLLHLVGILFPHIKFRIFGSLDFLYIILNSKLKFIHIRRNKYKIQNKTHSSVFCFQTPPVYPLHLRAVVFTHTHTHTHTHTYEVVHNNRLNIGFSTFIYLPVPVAARSNAWVCGRSTAEIVGSNLTGDMDVCCECCVLSGRGPCDELITRPEESY